MTRMTSKIARFASDFAQNLSIFSKVNSISPKSTRTRFGCGSPTESIAFFVWPLKTPTNKNATNSKIHYDGDARKNHCLNANKTLTVRNLKNT
jgi:hypothetical protein